MMLNFNFKTKIMSIWPFFFFRENNKKACMKIKNLLLHSESQTKVKTSKIVGIDCRWASMSKVITLSRFHKLRAYSRQQVINKVISAQWARERQESACYHLTHYYGSNYIRRANSLSGRSWILMIIFSCCNNKKKHWSLKNFIRLREMLTCQ